MYLVWLFCASLFAVVAEILIGNMGVYFPVFACSALYFLVTMGAKSAFPCLVPMALLLDLALSRSMPVTLGILIFLPMLSTAWSAYGEPGTLFSQIFPGFIVGVVAATLMVLLIQVPGTKLVGGAVIRAFLLFVEGVFGGIVCLPLVCLLYDGCAKRLLLPLYSEAKDRYEKEEF